MQTHRFRRAVAPAILLLFLATTAKTQSVGFRDSVIDLSTVYGRFTGAFVGFDTRSGITYRSNPALCATRLSPASTFKIPNSLIGLETGVIPDEHFVIPWDGVRRWSGDWNRNHDLASAIKYSVVWYYQELARRVGAVRMKHWIDTLGYGNGDISGGIDRFWLGSSLLISPNEQVIFLNRLRMNAVPFSARSIEIVKRIIPQDSGNGWVLHGKTGMADFDSTKAVGWYVGWVDRAEGSFVFANCLVTRDAQRDEEEIFAIRKKISVEILQLLKVIH